MKRGTTRRSIATLGVVVTIVATIVSCRTGDKDHVAESSRIPRTASHLPNLNGIWRATTTANWNLQDHIAEPAPVLALGAAGGVPAGRGIVDGDEIPYQEWAAEQKKKNAANWLNLDPEIKCYLPGVPRATYMPFPFQIVQSNKHIVIAYEFAHATRIVYMDNRADPGPLDTWMGYSRGHWDGDSLVVEVTDFNDQTWFDRSGNFHSDQLKVIERYTLLGSDHLAYEAQIEDPKVFTRPWRIRLILYRQVEKNVQLLEYPCVEFVEPLLYGYLSKPKS
jgi:hypothetical protein